MPPKNEQYDVVGEHPINYGIGYRHLQVFLTFTIMATCYVIRTSVSVAVIAMTDKSKNDTNWEIYDWDKKTQDYILSSFYWGYMILQIPAGQLAQIFGGKILLIFAMFSNGIIFMILPFFVRMGGWQAAFILRLLQGISQSCLMPSIHTMLGKWAPISERSRFGNFAIAGGPFGTVVSLPLSGYLCEYYGWPMAFQIIGAIAITMGIIFFWFAADTPDKHVKISKEEKLYIEASLGQNTKKRLKTPWRKIVTSIPFWALLIVHIGENWHWTLMLLEVPSYLNMALRLDMKKSSLYASLPFIIMWINGLMMSILADLSINKKIFSITVTRKIFNTIGACGSGLGIIILSFIPTTNVTLCVIFLMISVGLISTCNVGFMLNHIDLAPNFAGILMGITNSISNAIGVLAPISAGLILKDTSDQTQWRSVFFLSAGLCIITNAVFLIFGTSKRQSWNMPGSDIELEYIGNKKNNLERRNQ